MKILNEAWAYQKINHYWFAVLAPVFDGNDFFMNGIVDTRDKNSAELISLVPFMVLYTKRIAEFNIDILNTFGATGEFEMTIVQIRDLAERISLLADDSNSFMNSVTSYFDRNIEELISLIPFMIRIIKAVAKFNVNEIDAFGVTENVEINIKQAKDLAERVLAIYDRHKVTRGTCSENEEVIRNE